MRTNLLATSSERPNRCRCLLLCPVPTKLWMLGRSMLKAFTRVLWWLLVDDIAKYTPLQTLTKDSGFEAQVLVLEMQVLCGCSAENLQLTL